VRSITAEHLATAPALVVADVSFISLTKVIPVLVEVAAPSADLVLLTGELDGLSGPQAQWPNVRATICAGAVIYDAESDKAPTA
jgi:hypothetical protein